MEIAESAQTEIVDESALSEEPGESSSEVIEEVSSETEMPADDAPAVDVPAELMPMEESGDEASEDEEEEDEDAPNDYVKDGY